MEIIFETLFRTILVIDTVLYSECIYGNITQKGKSFFFFKQTILESKVNKFYSI